MSRKNAILLGSGLILATSGIANTNSVITSTDLGNSFEYKSQTFKANDINDADHIFTPSELNCAYQPEIRYSTRAEKFLFSSLYRVSNLLKRELGTKKQMRKLKRKERRQKRRGH